MDIKEYRNSLMQALGKKGFSGVEIAEMFNMTKQNVSVVLQNKVELVKGFIVESPDIWENAPCPKCGFGYVHFDNFSKYCDSYDPHCCGARNGCLRLPMWCESGHSFDLVITAHKGQTYIFWDNLGEKIIK